MVKERSFGRPWESCRFTLNSTAPSLAVTFAIVMSTSTWHALNCTNILSETVRRSWSCARFVIKNTPGKTSRSTSALKTFMLTSWFQTLTMCLTIWRISSSCTDDKKKVSASAPSINVLKSTVTRATNTTNQWLFEIPKKQPASVTDARQSSQHTEIVTHAFIAKKPIVHPALATPNFMRWKKWRHCSWNSVKWTEINKMPMSNDT